MYRSAVPVRAIRLNTHTQQVCYSFYPSHNKSGRVFLWISLQGYPHPKAKIVSLGWQIASLHMPTSSEFPPKFRHLRQQKYSSKEYFDCMVFQKPLSASMIVGSWEHSGRSYSGQEARSSLLVQVTTRRQTKAVNKWVEGYLQNYVIGKQRAWTKWLYLGENFYNTTYDMSIGISSFQELYGYAALSFVDTNFGDNRATLAKDWIQGCQDILRALKDNLQTTQNQQKLYANQQRIEIFFEVGNVVYLCLQPYIQFTLKHWYHMTWSFEQREKFITYFMFLV